MLPKNQDREVQIPLNDSEGLCMSVRGKDQEEMFINKMKENWNQNEGQAGQSIKNVTEERRAA